MDPIEQILVALVAVIAQAVAHEAVPLIVAALRSPSTAQEGFTDESLRSRLAAAVQDPPSAAD